MHWFVLEPQMCFDKRKQPKAEKKNKVSYLLVEAGNRMEQQIWEAAQFWHYLLVYIAFPKGKGNPIFLFMEVNFLTDQWAHQHLKQYI